MKQGVYTARDTVAEDDFAIFLATTDGMAIRDNLPYLAHTRPIKDIEIYCIGEYDTETQNMNLVKPCKVDMNAYKFPETKSKEYSAETVRKAQEKFNADTRDIEQKNREEFNKATREAIENKQGE